MRAWWAGLPTSDQPSHGRSLHRHGPIGILGQLVRSVALGSDVDRQDGGRAGRQAHAPPGGSKRGKLRKGVEHTSSRPLHNPSTPSFGGHRARPPFPFPPVPSLLTRFKGGGLLSGSLGDTSTCEAHGARVGTGPKAGRAKATFKSWFQSACVRGSDPAEGSWRQRQLWPPGHEGAERRFAETKVRCGQMTRSQPQPTQRQYNGGIASKRWLHGPIGPCDRC